MVGTSGKFRDRRLVIENPDACSIAGPEDIRGAAEALHEISMACGLRAAIAHDIADKRTPVEIDGNVLADAVFGWGDNEKVWWRNSRIALDSPLTLACRFENEPFWMNREGIHSRAVNPYLQEINLANFEKRAGTRAAIVVPVHMPFGIIGVGSFNALDSEETDLGERFDKYADLLGHHTRRFVSEYALVMGKEQALPPGSRLSKREVECLRWAAIGKTDLEISMIMSRSRATVRFHIKNASTKLNSVNRSQTLFKASQLGYISLAN